MNILLLGAAGQVGDALRAPLASLGTVTCATRTGRVDGDTRCLEADLSNPDSLRNALESARADVIVNAAAYTAVDRAESEPELADRINHQALGQIGDWAARNGSRVLHYSTDYVFDGQGRRPWREDDATAPLGTYGRSKLAGEQALRASGATHRIVRTAWVYAARGHNFLLTMLRLASERDELRVVNDQTGAPTPARWIADLSTRLLQRWIAAGADAARGDTVHLSAGGQCTWHGFASAIFAAAKEAGLIARVPRVMPISSAEFAAPAPRPAWSVLDNDKLEREYGLRAGQWQEGLRSVIDELVATRKHGELQ